MKRTDPAGSSALLIFNFSAEAQSVPIAGDSNAGDCSYGQETRSTVEARDHGRLKLWPPVQRSPCHWLDLKPPST